MECSTEKWHLWREEHEYNEGEESGACLILLMKVVRRILKGFVKMNDREELGNLILRTRVYAVLM